MSKTYLVSFGIVNQAAALALCRPWLLFFLLEGTPARRSFAPDVVRDPLRQLSGAAPDATTNKAGRTRRAPARRSFAPDVVRDPLRQLSGAAPDATTNKAGRTRRGTYRSSPRETHTTQPRSPNTACWRFSGRQGRLHQQNSSLQRLRSELTLRKSTAREQLLFPRQSPIEHREAQNE